MAKSFLDSPNLPVLVLGGAGLYFLSKSDFFKGLGKVGGGVGEAVGGLGSGISQAGRGLGSGISTIGEEAGDIVVDVGSVLEPFAAGFEGIAGVVSEFFNQQENNLRREGEQSAAVDNDAFSKSNEILSSIQATRDINTAREKAERKGLFQNQLTDVTRVFTNFDENIGSVLRGAKEFTGTVLGNVSASFSRALRRDKPVSLTSEPATGGSVSLPSISSSSSSGRNISVRSSGGSSSSSRNFTPAPRNMSVAPTTTKSPSIRQRVTSTVSSAVSKAKSTTKSLISSISKKLRSIF